MPPHWPVYQNQFEPVTRDPPAGVNVTGTPAQMLVGFAETEVGAIFPVTTIEILIQVVVLQVPSPLTQ